MLPVSRTAANALIDELVDPDSFVAWSPAELGIKLQEASSVAYAEELDKARCGTGRDESIVVGTARIGGNPVVLVLGDFDFLAGSVGRGACQLVIAAFEKASGLGLPVFASPSSGGTRMQEGTAAFVLMADVAAAVRRFREGANALIVWLRNPTTGGVMATWGSLGTVTFGEPGALTGFLGPRVFEMLTGESFPANVQTAENLAAHGVIDSVVHLAQLRETVARIVHVVTDAGVAVGGGERVAIPTSIATPDPWECVQRTEIRERPTAPDVLAANLTEVTCLSGTTQGERSESVSVRLAKWRGISVVVAAQDRAAQGAGNQLNPAGLRTARRAFAVAQELGLPLVSIVDTAGAELSAAAEEAALAGEIARCLADLATLTVPTVSVLLGMGCGGGALAMLPADRVVSAEYGWVSPLPLEGASIIRYRTADRAADMARDQEIAAWQLAQRGIVDTVVPEDSEFISKLGVAVEAELMELLAQRKSDRLMVRRARYQGGLTHG